MKQYLVFDVGGTFTKYALMDDDARILKKGKVPTPHYKDHTKEDFYQVLDGVVAACREQISGIAVSMPGMLDSTRGFANTAGSTVYLTKTAVGPELSERYGLPVSIENDGKSAALAELWRGNLQGYDNSAVVVLGTGVGGGIIIGGEVYRGNRFTAGEFSFVCTDTSDADNMDRHWGRMSGAKGLAKAVAKYTGEDWESYTGERIFELANAGDENACRGLKEYTDNLAVMLYNLNIILDLDMIALGGGISQQPLLLEYVRQSLDDYYVKVRPKTIAPHIPMPTITHCRFYNDANLIGALYHFKQLYKES